MPERKPITKEELTDKKAKLTAQTIAALKAKPEFKDKTYEEIEAYLDSQKSKKKEGTAPEKESVAVNVEEQKRQASLKELLILLEEEAMAEQEKKEETARMLNEIIAQKEATNVLILELETLAKELFEKEQLEKNKQREAEAAKAKQFIFEPQGDPAPLTENAETENNTPPKEETDPEQAEGTKEEGEATTPEAPQEEIEGEEEKEVEIPNQEEEENTTTQESVVVPAMETGNIILETESEILQTKLDALNEKIRNTPGWNIFKGTIYAIKQWQLEGQIKKAKQEEAKIEASKENREKLFELKSKYDALSEKIKECYLRMNKYKPEDAEWKNLYKESRLLLAEEDGVRKLYEQIKKKEYPFVYYLVDKIKNPFIKNLLTAKTEDGEQYVSLEENQIFYNRFAENPLNYSEIDIGPFESSVKRVNNTIKYNLSGFSIKILNLEELIKDADEGFEISDPKARYEVINPDGKKIIEQVDYNNALAIYQQATEQYINKVEKEFTKLTNKQ